MRSFALSAFVAIASVSMASASGKALTTLHPCPDCPASDRVAPITVTSQLQPVWTCEAVTKTVKKKEFVTPSCSNYDFLSTSVPCLGGASTTLITKTDQYVELSHVSTVLTSYVEVPTACPTAPKYGNETVKYPNATCTSTSTAYQTMVVDLSAPYNECGPLALPPWEGSGLCSTCVSGDSKEQVVHVSKCLDGVCSTYEETWVSTKPVPAKTTSTAERSFSTAAYCSQSGVNTIPLTATFTPSDNAEGYTAPVTSTFAHVTSVAKPCSVDITKVITVTYTKKPEPTVQYSTSVAPVSTTTYCSNGAHTIPIVTTCTPHGSHFTAPETTTVWYTTTVTDGPKPVSCTKTVTVTFTSTSSCPPVTVVSGHTQRPTGPPSVSATTTPPYSASTTSAPVTSAPTTSAPTSIPTAPTTVGECDYYGCLGSWDGFPSFHKVESSGAMDIEICTSECQASGFSFAGLYTTDCYCAGSVGHSTSEKANGFCDLPCPGSHTESCGGNALGPRHSAPNPILLDVYECKASTTTSSTSTSTSGGSDPSSDPDSAPVPRGLDADMEPAAPRPRDVKVRRGGLLRNPKVVNGPAVAKRDFGLKKPFGQ